MSERSPPSSQRVLITGATGVIGRALVDRFARDGALVGIHYHSRKADAATLAARARELGGDGVAVEGDLSSVAGATAVVERFLEAAGGIDTLINNAGGNDDRLLYYLDEASWRRTLAFNLDAVYAVCRKALAAMVPERNGAIVNVSSISALKGLPGQTAYAAAKAGLHGFSRSLAREVGRFNIRVNVIAPGAIESPSIGDLSDEKRRWLEESACLERLGRAEEIASVAAFLASEDASFITGQILPVDGGIV